MKHHSLFLNLPTLVMYLFFLGYPWRPTTSIKKKITQVMQQRWRDSTEHVILFLYTDETIEC